MSRNMPNSNEEYKKKLYEARKYFNFSFDGRNKLTPARKAAISRAYNQLEMIDREKAEFITMNKYQRHKNHDAFPDIAFTSKGVFVDKGAGVKKIELDNGIITQKYTDFRTETHAINPDKRDEFLDDPASYFEELLSDKKPDYVFLKVGPQGYNGLQRYSPEAFLWYITNKIDVSEGITGMVMVFGDKDMSHAGDFGNEKRKKGYKKMSKQKKQLLVKKGRG